MEGTKKMKMKAKYYTVKVVGGNPRLPKLPVSLGSAAVILAIADSKPN